MRITNPTLLRGYTRDLNRVLNLKNEAEHKITTQRRFSRASEAPLSAAKALNVRKSQYYSAQHQENLKVAAKFYTEAETSLIQVSGQMAIIRETIIAACNSTKDYQDLDIYAQQLETKAHELCAIFNTDSAGRAIFGGESDNPQPFSIINDADGHAATVTYHGIPVNSMKDFSKFPYSDEVNLDIGLGMVVDQETHEVDPDSVLRISFNGPEVAGCGAERGVADIDLSSITDKRHYSLYVYAGDVKQEINFIGQSTKADNVKAIQAELDKAFKKEIAYGRPRPKIDDQGVISLIDKMGDAVDGGVVSVINNPYPESKHISQLKVDNDSNYTNKYRLALDKLAEGETYRVDVQVGDGEKKTIEFEAGTDNLSDPNNPIFREDITVKNFQAALDKAFGEGEVSISPNDPTKGVITAEGNIVKLFEPADKIKDPDEETSVYEKAIITSADGADVAPSNHLNIAGLEKDTLYVMELDIGGTKKKVEFETGKSNYETKKAIAEAVEREFSGGTLKIENNGTFIYTRKDGSKPDVTISPTSPGTVDNNVDVTGGNKLDLKKFTANNTYSLNVTIGKETKEIRFEGGAGVRNNIIGEIKEAFPDVDETDLKFSTDGTLTYTKDGTDMGLTLSKAEDAAPAKSIELGKKTEYTIDLNELEEGKKYSLKFIVGNEVKNIEFTAKGTAGENATEIKNALNGFAEVANDGKVTAAGGKTVAVSNNPNPDENKDKIYERECAYSYNYIQLTLDAARALRQGDIEYANGCIDRLVEANEKLLVEIADMGCNEEFIDFNLSRLTVRDENLAERQNDLEIIDPAKEITLWKQYEAMYNACLQMSSAAIPQSIFNYMK